MHSTAINAFRYLRRKGLKRFFLRIVEEIPYSAKRTYYWFKFQLTGRFVELCGNKWQLDGLTFSLDAPPIVTSLKGRFFWNTYEDRERTLVKKHILPNLPVIEGGGSIGVISCLTNSLLKNPEKHLVVEANPDLFAILKKNRDLNHCQFEIVEAAMDENGPTVTFYLHRKSVGSSAQRATEKAITMPAVTVAGLLKRTGWEKVSLVVDIEGAEIDLIKHESEALKNHVAVFIVEMHPMISSEAEIAEALATIERLGFTLKDRALDVYAYYNERLLAQ
jgi:FkbM family methyltransferase